MHIGQIEGPQILRMEPELHHRKGQLLERESVVIRFAGDSGDGMQTVGEQFTDTSAFAGNDISTLPDYPAEIRAPAGSLPGVSGFQIQFGSKRVLTPGDAPDALVAMNPAALKTNLEELAPGGMLLLNTAAFEPSNLKLAGYTDNPLEDAALEERYEVVKMDLNRMTLDSLAESPLKQKEKLRCKNFFALGFLYWVYGRPLEPTVAFLERKWGKRRPELAEANIRVLKAGYYFGETTERHRPRYLIAHAAVESGVYRKISGNEALAMGLIVAAEKAQRSLFYSGYPITPASSILEVLAARKHWGVMTVQAEDEIAAIGMALGASYAGCIGVTGTSGPGLCLKSEFMGLAISTELPLVVCDIQRGGPSTGLPTKTEQADLMQALYGRHGDSPVPVVAARSPSDCFNAALEACRIALKYSTPVLLLSDLYLANGSEPWRVPDPEAFADISVPFANGSSGDEFRVFARDPETLSRRQAIPGQAGFEHRIGGLEKDERGSVSYDPENHEAMTRLRLEKIARIAESYPPLQVHGAAEGDLLVLGWGGTYGAITSAVDQLQAEGYSISSLHLRNLNPLPNDLGDVLRRYRRILIPELNMGQLSMLIRARYLVDAQSFNKVKGRPFRILEMKEKMLEVLREGGLRA